MECLIRFSQIHETFRLPEIKALAIIEGIDLKVLSYSPDSPFCLAVLPSPEAAAALVRRSILAQSIHEHWGGGATLPALHASVRDRTSHLWSAYGSCSFKFTVDSFQGRRAAAARIDLINTFAYVSFAGPIHMRDPDETFTLFELWPPDSTALGIPDPDFYHFGRLLGLGARDLPQRLDLKKRRYISTTSMDSALALVTANIALAAPGKLFYDPFAGTGSFPIACAQFGAVSWGSDIDGRSMRGDEGGDGKRTVKGNFDQYGLLAGLGDMFSADLTNSPVRRVAPGQGGMRLFDGIVCDPPYGVREGLRVLGCRDPEKCPWVIEAGIKMWRLPEYVPPKKPYSLTAMLDDILQFAAETLVDNGRLSFWVPTANDEEQEVPIPTNPCLELVALCVQPFNKWSRRLITYRRLPDAEVDLAALDGNAGKKQHFGTTADELNPFRRGYFNKFQA